MAPSFRIRRIHTGHLSKFSTALMVAILFLVPAVNSDPGKTGCLVPDDTQLLAMLLSNGGVVLIPPGTEGDGRAQSFAQDPREFFGVGQTDLDSPVTPGGDWHCPVGERPPRGAPANELAVCPWRFVVDRDPARYPPTVARAVSRCSACLGPGGSVMDGTRCEPVIHQGKVLRQRGCEQPGGVMGYEVEDMPQTVAFQCTFISNSP